MKSKKDGGTVLVFDTGYEVVSTLTRFAKDHGIGAAQVDELVEVVSLIGDIALDKGEPKVHAHVARATRLGRELIGQNDAKT